MTNKIQYENVFKGKHGVLYARLYNSETKEVTVEAVRSIPDLFIEANENSQKSGYISIPEKKHLRKMSFKSMKEYNDTLKLYKASNIPMYGNKSVEQNYIRENWPNPIDSYHEFSNIWFWDIETAVLDDTVDKSVSKDDWKPFGHERASMATITSIQIYDTKAKIFFILGLKKDWKNKNNFTDPNGEIKYIKCESEEKLLKTFLELLKRRNPAIMTGWNTELYDDAFVTNRIIRVLDKRDDLYYYDKIKKRWRFNTDCLNGHYVQQLSPHANLIKHREVPYNSNINDVFLWTGIIQEDYLNLYKKYTYTSHTSYSLSSIATYELSSDKVKHDEFTDFASFYLGDIERYGYNADKENKNELDEIYIEYQKTKDEKLKEKFKELAYSQFIEYGVTDVSLLVDLNKKLKLLSLASFISYYCGVTMDSIRGTIKQWVSLMYNNHFKEKQVLPMEGKFDKVDTVLLEHAIKMNFLDPERKKAFQELYNNPETRGQAFPGGITRGTGKFWKEVFSLDFSGLYPHVIQWANIGIETLIQPKDLPKELLDLRAKYAIYYPKNVEAKDLIQFDFRFSNHVLNNKEAREEISRVLKKYNVTMTPNGMFFDRSVRSILSKTMEDIIALRKKYKKDMKATEKAIQDLTDEMEKLNNNTSEFKEKLNELKDLQEQYDVYQMGLKILVNSAYGALSNVVAVFAGDKEYFSSAVTSASRIANLIAGQANNKKINEICGLEAKEIQYGELTYQDHTPQIDTDSVTGDSIIQVDNDRMTIERFYKTAEGIIEKRGEDNFIKHIRHLDLFTPSINKETGKIENKKIKYIMAHKVTKKLFEISYKDKKVTVTEDHSVIVLRGKEYIDAKPKDIKEGDKIILSNLYTTGDFMVKNIGTHTEWVYDLEVADNHNFFANHICVHNSNYISILPVIEKKFGKDYRETQKRSRITEFTVNYINKISLPVTYETLDMYSETMNAYLPEKLIEDPEVICDNFISIAPKMYFARKWWDEGLTLSKPKLKITGLSTIRSSTPKFYRAELKKAMDILIEGDIPNVIKFIDKVKEETEFQKPSQICINQGVSSLDYEWHEQDKKFKKWVPESNKWLSAPVNSRASLVHNLYIRKNNIDHIREIEPGNKIGFLYMKEPNIVNSNVFAFLNEAVFKYGLEEYIDKKMMFEKGFLNNIKLITEPIGWDLTPKEDQIDDDEW